MKEKVESRIVFYMTKNEKDLLSHFCTKNNRKCSNLLRNMTLEMIGNKPQEVKKFDVNFLRYLGELSANANNLNQIAKKVNQGLQLNILDERKIQDQVRIILEQIQDLKLRL